MNDTDTPIISNATIAMVRIALGAAILDWLNAVGGYSGCDTDASRTGLEILGITEAEAIERFGAEVASLVARTEVNCDVETECGPEDFDGNCDTRTGGEITVLVEGFRRRQGYLLDGSTKLAEIASGEWDDEGGCEGLVWK